MAVVRKPTIKATFETGDRPTEAEFGDFIDTFVPIETDGAVGFMEVISTASSLARPSETLVAIATAVQGGKLGVIEVLATADVTALPAGAVGREVLSAAATASAQGHLGGGTVGIQIFETTTTVAAQDIIGIVTASETAFGVVEIATATEMEETTATDRVATPANLPDYFKLETLQATTSGTAFDFTGIRASAKRITVMFDLVSLSGTDSILVQIGTGGSPTTTGYTANSTAVTFTTGFGLAINNAARQSNGDYVLELIDSTNNIWVGRGSVGSSTSAAFFTGQGRVALSGTLDNIRITRDGSNTFDNGQVNILIE